MNCKKLETWLSSRDVHDDSLSREVDSHLAACAECRNIFHADLQLEARVKNAMNREDPPPELYARINETLDRKSSRSFSTAWKVSALTAAVSLLAVFLYAGIFSGPHRFKNLQELSSEAVSMHLDGNTRMTFNAARIDEALMTLSRELRFNVVLPDLSAEGYVLLGGRLCTVGDCRAAYLFYEKNSKIGSVFIMDYSQLEFEMADGSRYHNVVKGYRTDIWKANSQVYAMVY